MADPQIIYYQDELKDEFSTAKITPKRIDGSYRYDGGCLRGVGRFFWYDVVAKPLASLFLKVKFHHKIVNGECLKEAGTQGIFLYGNHTHALADALIPTMVAKPKGVYVIVHPNNVSMPVLGRITPCLGALPLPDDMEGMKNFTRSIRSHIEKGECIHIYPEAHIWPYYTGIRAFTDNSFAYPVKHHAPVYCFTNTYQKWKNSDTPQIVTYVDGPFWANESLNAKEQRKVLRDQVYETMKKRSENNNVELIRYVKADSESDKR